MEQGGCLSECSFFFKCLVFGFFSYCFLECGLAHLNLNKYRISSEPANAL